MKNFFTKHHVIVILLIIVALIGGIMLFSLFKKDKPIKDIYFEKYMALKDSQVNHALQDAKMYMDLYLAKSKEDSITMANFVQSQKIFAQTISNQLKNVPINISHIANNDDSIRLYFSRFQ